METKDNHRLFNYRPIVIAAISLIFGVLTTVVSVVTYVLFANLLFSEKTDITVQISNVLSWVCAVIFAYITNRKYVFNSSSQGKEKYKEVFNFFLARFSSLVIDMTLMFVLFSLMFVYSRDRSLP